MNDAMFPRNSLSEDSVKVGLHSLRFQFALSLEQLNKLVVKSSNYKEWRSLGRKANRWNNPQVKYGVLIQVILAVDGKEVHRVVMVTTENDLQNLTNFIQRRL